MKYIELVTNADNFDAIMTITEKIEAKDIRFEAPSDDEMQLFRIIVKDDNFQDAIDYFSRMIDSKSTARLVAMPIEVYLPKQEVVESKEENAAVAAREAIYNDVEKNAYINSNFIVLVVLSTIVATIGLIENNIAVVVGAMVIAPLLGPNIALSLATSLGDTKLMLSSIKTVALGVILSILLAIFIGLLGHFPLDSPEILSRAEVGLDSVILALASGAAAALSVTTGLSSVLVGVMVAVALLPPAVVFGLMLGSGNNDLAANAGILLAVNIICVNLASKIVFLFKNITPRRWVEKEKAKKQMYWYMVTWIISLLGLLLFIYVR